MNESVRPMHENYSKTSCDEINPFVNVVPSPSM